MVHVEDFKLHEIFTVDPLVLRNYVNHYVQVTLKNGSTLFGTVYTIDPVSQRNNGSLKLNEDIKTERERVKLWLLKNLIPVEEVGDILKLETLEIHPPYNAENCCSNNAIVLDRIQNLLKELKGQHS